ncbi:hypothetical protein [Brevibacillus sp. JB24b]|uniref:hypothetical protein n=1 Tax=Brevibacillus sp. JB24b TaxID=3422308 RepID=UPI003F688344
MKKLVLTGVLSVGALMGANLPGLEVISAHAAIPSSLSIAEGNSQQTLFEQQREKYTGIVTGKTNQGLTIFTENVPANVLKNINIGDSVDIYSSYSSKVAENKAEDFIIGTVTDSDSDYGYATVEYKNNEGKTETVDVTFTEAHTYKVGDKVKVTNKSKWEHKKIGPNDVTFASGDFISKVAEKEAEDFIIGTVTDSDSDYGYATVEYKNNEGKTETVDVTFTEAHTYKVGDKVKVTNKSKWEHKKIGPNDVTFASGDFISKVTENE